MTTLWFLHLFTSFEQLRKFGTDSLSSPILLLPPVSVGSTRAAECDDDALVLGLYTFQATMAKSHKVKSKYLISFCQAFGAKPIARIFHTFVVPVGKAGEFAISGAAPDKLAVQRGGEQVCIPVKYFVGEREWAGGVRAAAMRS